MSSIIASAYDTKDSKKYILIDREENKIPLEEHVNYLKEQATTPYIFTSNKIRAPEKHPGYIKSAVISAKIETALSDVRSMNILIPRFTEVRNYLLRYLDMCKPVVDVCEVVRGRLGIHILLSLELYQDPEIEDEYLVLYIRQETYDQKILDMIEKICAEYEKTFSEMSGWLIVMPNFSPSRE